MRIGWFTDFTAGSAPARFSQTVIEELSRFVDVDIWHPKTERAEPTRLRTIAYSRNPAAPALADYDLLVYNGSIGPAREAPGIVILEEFREEALRRPYGVAVHSEGLLERVRAVFPGPIARLSPAWSARGYAAAFMKLGVEVLVAKPLLQLMDRAAERLAGVGAAGDEAVLDRVAADGFELFCGEDGR